MSVAPFRGWPPEALAWFAGLEADNSRAWFQANRPTYDAAVRGPFESLLAEAADEFGDGAVTRPNRDTRFSPDKSPYKTRCYARLPQPGGASLFVQLRPEGLFAGGGLYRPERGRLAAMRHAIADDAGGAALERVVAGLEADGLHLLRDGGLKTAPRGHPIDHPRIALLRLPGLGAGVDHAPGPWLHTAEARDRVFGAWRSLRPLLGWLNEHVPAS